MEVEEEEEDAESTPPRTLLFAQLEESPLSYIERQTRPEGSDFWKEISNLLRSHGALGRRRCRLINFCDIQAISKKQRQASEYWYALSQDQSDRIVESYKWKLEDRYIGESRDGRRPRLSNHAFAQVIAYIRSSLTKADVVDNSTYVLQSSFKSEIDQT